jgi:hypothetical protein
MNLTPEILSKMYDQLRPTYPYLRAIWIVDIPLGSSLQFQRYIESALPEHNDSASILPIPPLVREWKTGVSKGEAPWFTLYPGFWAEMSDGNHYQIVFPPKERGL